MDKKAEISAAAAILEQVAQAAIAAARRCAAGAARGDEHDRGAVMAYYDVLDVIAQQRQVLDFQFHQRDLNDFDPEELLRLSAPKQKAA